MEPIKKTNELTFAQELAPYKEESKRSQESLSFLRSVTSTEDDNTGFSVINMSLEKATKDKEIGTRKLETCKPKKLSEKITTCEGFDGKKIEEKVVNKWKTQCYSTAKARDVIFHLTGLIKFKSFYFAKGSMGQLYVF